MPEPVPSGTSRRTLLRTAVWSLPLVATAPVTPAYAACSVSTFTSDRSAQASAIISHSLASSSLPTPTRGLTSTEFAPTVPVVA